jgi:glutaminyl-peptide cyclotransferase
MLNVFISTRSNDLERRVSVRTALSTTIVSACIALAACGKPESTSSSPASKSSSASAPAEKATVDATKSASSATPASAASAAQGSPQGTNGAKPAPEATKSAKPADATNTPVAKFGYEVVHTFPHDPEAFTQGLIFQNGMLYESTGLYGKSSLRRVILQVGQILNRVDFQQGVFAEGITLFDDKIFLITWKTQKGYVFDPTSLQQLAEFSYGGEGWGLTHDASALIMSNGSSKLIFVDPKTLAVVRTLDVTLDKKPVDQLNELEYVKGEIFANVWKTSTILRIDPMNGRVVGTVDLTGIYTPKPDADLEDDVLNGIAYDEKGDRLFVTGKRWPSVFEIKLVKK